MILRSIAEMLIQEHEHRPIQGRLLALGPEEVAITQDEIDALFTASDRRRGIIPTTPRRAPGVECATDEYFFGKFPIESLDSLDVVEGRGATVVHDLNYPIPDCLANRFDFILDGGTFDHLLNVGIALENVVRMLKPGGRVFQYNAASNYMGKCYTEFGPDLFNDYYALNGFVDCKVYVARETENEANAPWDVFYLNKIRTRDLNCGKRQMVVVIAEKGEQTLGHVLPVEAAYRTTEMTQAIAEAKLAFAKSKRPRLRGDLGLMSSSVAEHLRLVGWEAKTIVHRIRTGKFSYASYRAKRAKNRWVNKPYSYVGRI